MSDRKGKVATNEINVHQRIFTAVVFRNTKSLDITLQSTDLKDGSDQEFITFISAILKVWASNEQADSSNEQTGPCNRDILKSLVKNDRFRLEMAKGSFDPLLASVIVAHQKNRDVIETCLTSPEIRERFNFFKRAYQEVYSIPLVMEVFKTTEAELRKNDTPMINRNPGHIKQ